MTTSQELEDTKQAIAIAKNRLDNATTALEIDAAVHELQAAEIRFREAYRRLTGRVA